MSTMRISMPLAGMDPTSEMLRDKRERLNADENRAFRMLSEGELFYVDTDMHEDQLGASRHDHGHLGGVSLEEIRRSMEDRKEGQAVVLKLASSLADTEAASRSTSQDSSDTGDAWQPLPHQKQIQQHHQQQYRSVASSKPTTTNSTYPSTASCQQAQRTQHQLQAAKERMDERSGRERSFSEPQLSNCAGRLASHLPPQFPPVSSSMDPQASMARRRTSIAGDPSARESQDGREFEGKLGVLQKSLSCFFGEPKVDVMSRHLTSCTSQKTFDISAFDRDQDALARLGVVPDNWVGLREGGSMTFTMHIAGYR